MNISKVKIIWKFLTGGREAVLDYVLDVANALMARVAETDSAEKAKTYFNYAQKILETLAGLKWLCPDKWQTAYGLTVTAFADTVTALADLRVTNDELIECTSAFQAAYSAWRAE